MITVTERAKEKLESMLTSKVDNSQAALRLIATHEGEYGLHVDIENPGDKVVKYNGRKLPDGAGGCDPSKVARKREACLLAPAAEGPGRHHPDSVKDWIFGRIRQLQHI